MRGLAEYVMRGRMQALWVAVLGASTLMFSWISAAVIALVTLRKGPVEGAYILAWAVLPAGFLLYAFGDSGPLGMLLGSMALALVLRWLGSWPLVLWASVAIGLVTGAALLGFGSGFLQQLAAFFGEFISQMQAQYPEAEFRAPGLATIAGMIGLINAVSCVLCLLLARWWQALLYNPGGFREEFHGLRLSPQESVVLVLGMLGVSAMGVEYTPWAMILALPLSMAGLGFVHARAAHRNLGAVWLGLFYLLWLLLDLVKLIVVGVAVADSWIDFRSRWSRANRDND